MALLWPPASQGDEGNHKGCPYGSCSVHVGGSVPLHCCCIPAAGRRVTGIAAGMVRPAGVGARLIVSPGQARGRLWASFMTPLQRGPSGVLIWD